MGVAIGDVTPDDAKFFQVNKAIGAVVTPGGAGLSGGEGWTEGGRRHH